MSKDTFIPDFASVNIKGTRPGLDSPKNTSVEEPINAKVKANGKVILIPNL